MRENRKWRDVCGESDSTVEMMLRPVIGGYTRLITRVYANRVNRCQFHVNLIREAADNGV